MGVWSENNHDGLLKKIVSRNKIKLMMELKYDKRKEVWSVEDKVVASRSWKIIESVLTERYGLKGQLWYKVYFHMVYRLKDIAKLLNFLFKSELNLNLLKSEIF